MFIIAWFLYVIIHRRVIFSFKNFGLIYKQLIISFLISLLLFYLILKKYPKFKLFFSLDLLKKNYNYSTFSSRVDYSAKNNICTLGIINHKENYTLFNINTSEDLLSRYKKVYGTIFLINKPYQLLIGKSKFYRKIYRDIPCIICINSFYHNICNNFDFIHKTGICIFSISTF